MLLTMKIARRGELGHPQRPCRRCGSRLHCGRVPPCAKVGCPRPAAWRPQLIVPDSTREVVLVLPFQVCDEHRDATLVHQFAAAIGDRLSDLARTHGIPRLDWSRARIDFVRVT
jgi:hypothetical protein